MTSPFRSIFDHEKEHQLMARNRAGDHLLTPKTSEISNTTYNGDGTLASATIGGVPYTFTYSAGKIATVAGGGVTKTYTWSGDQLVSVEVA